MKPSSNSAMTKTLMKKAEMNLDAALESERVFPQNVFKGSWDAFYFFDPDSLFEPQSVERFRALLACEHGALV